MVKYGFKKVLILFKKERRKKKEYKRKYMHLPRESWDARFPRVQLSGVAAADLSPSCFPLLLGDHTSSSAHIHTSRQNLLTMATPVRRLCPSEMPLSKLAQESSLVYADFGLCSKRP